MDKPMNQNTTHHPNLATLRRWAAATCLLVGTLLSSCGGQSSGTATTAGDGDSQNSGGNSNTAVSAMAGAYQGSVSYVGNPYPSDFVSFQTPAGAWYGLYFLKTSSASVYPDIYTGTVTATSASSATISPAVLH